MIDTKQLEKDLNDDSKNKAEVIKELVVSIDEIVISNKALLKLSEEAASIAEKANASATLYFKAALDMKEALLNIHLILNSEDKKSIDELKLMLAKWVLKPESIQLAVMSNALKTSEVSTGQWLSEPNIQNIPKKEIE